MRKDDVWFLEGYFRIYKKKRIYRENSLKAIKIVKWRKPIKKV